MDYFHGRATSLKEAFPEPFITHALAVKANSMRGVLLEAKNLGLGGECASLQEAKHCLSLGNYQYNIICHRFGLGGQRTFLMAQFLANYGVIILPEHGVVSLH